MPPLHRQAFAGLSAAVATALQAHPGPFVSGMHSEQETELLRLEGSGTPVGRLTPMTLAPGQVIGLSVSVQQGA